MMCYFLLFLGLCHSTILRSKHLQMEISSRFLTPKNVEKAHLVDKSWVDVGKVFEKITPMPGLFKNRQTDETMFETNGTLMNASELSAELEQNEDDRVIIQKLIEENDWNRLFFKLIPLHAKMVRNFVKVLAEIVDVRAVDSNQRTSLHLATQNECYDAVRTLLANQADPNLKDEFGRTALHFAVRVENVDLIEILVKYNAEINATNIKLETPLMASLKRDTRRDSMEALLRLGANVNLQNEDGQSALHIAVVRRTSDYIDTLAWYGADMNAVDNNLDTPLHAVCDSYYTSSGAAERLLANGAAPNQKNKKGQTALHFAASTNKIDDIEVLLTYSAEIDANDDNLETPTMFAARFGHFEAMKVFFKHKANFQLKNKDGEAILHLAASCSSDTSTQVINFLLKEGAELNATDNDLKTPLMLAAAHGHPNSVEALLLAGADCNQKIKGQTAMHRAAIFNKSNNIKVLMRYGADIESKCDSWYDQTPLLRAAHYGSFDALETLLSLNANCKQRDKNGRSSLHLAASATWGEKVPLIEILLNNGANIDETDNQLETPLMSAAKTGRRDSVNALLNHNADHKMKNKYGKTALHLAISYNHVGIIAIFLKYTGEIYPQTPFMLGREFKNLDAMKSLIVCESFSELKDHNGKRTLFLEFEVHDEKVNAIRNVLENVDDIWSKTSLKIIHAAYAGDSMDIKCIFCDETNPNFKDEHGWTAVHYAAASNRVGLIKRLLELKANLNELDNSFKTPFMIALLRLNLRSAKFLFSVFWQKNYIKIVFLLIPLVLSFFFLSSFFFF